MSGDRGRVSVGLVGLISVIGLALAACDGGDASPPDARAQAVADAIPRSPADTKTETPAQAAADASGSGGANADATPPAAQEPPPLEGEGPSGAVGRDARREAVLALLGDGKSAAALELAAADPGRRFDPDLAETMTPKVWVSSRPASTRPPTVEQGRLEVKGPLDKDIIRRIVKAHINELRHCYGKSLDATPGLRGSVVIEFGIAKGGDVPVSTVAESKVADPQVANCFAKAIRRWKFPKPVGGANVEVRYEFRLSPKGH